MNKYVQFSIGKEKAIQLAKSKWWEGLTDKQIALVQLFTKEMCMNFGDFHKCVESALGRPVFTHEFGFNLDGIIDEILGNRKPPTLNEILEIIPKDKTTILIGVV